MRWIAPVFTCLGLGLISLLLCLAIAREQYDPDPTRSEAYRQGYSKGHDDGINECTKIPAMT